MTYTYKSPLADGFVQVNLSKAYVRRFAPFEHLSWINRIKTYQKGTLVEVEVYTSLLAIILNTLLYPISLLFSGFRNISEVNSEFYRLFNEQKTGSFTSFTFNDTKTGDRT